MTDKTKGTDQELSFSEAMEELERILRGVEGEETDIDVLGDELKRAAQLLELCRGKIRRAEVEVTQIVQSLEDGSTDHDGGSSDEESEQVANGNGEEELPF